MMDITFIAKMTNELPEKFIINSLEDALAKYNVINNKETRRHLLSQCKILIIKERILEIGVEKTIQEANNVGQLNKFFKNVN